MTKASQQLQIPNAMGYVPVTSTGIVNVPSFGNTTTFNAATLSNGGSVQIR